MNAQTRNTLARYAQTSEGGRRRMLKSGGFPYQTLVIPAANAKGRTAFLHAVASLIHEVKLETTITLMWTLRSEDLPATELGVYDNKKAKIAWLEGLRGKWIDQVLIDLDANQVHADAITPKVGPILQQFTSEFLKLIVEGTSSEELVKWMRAQGVSADAIARVEEFV